jgi:hypothetical protein
MSSSDYEVDVNELDLIKSVVGISSFDSSKGRDHTSSGAYGIMKVSKRKVRDATKKFKDEKRNRKKIRRNI